MPVESLVAHLFVLRFPLLSLALLIFFPLIALRFLRSLLANLLDLTGYQLIWVTVCACVLSWTTLITGWMIVIYGADRFRLEKLPWQLQEIPGWPEILFMYVFTLPLLVAAIAYSKSQQCTSVRRLVGGCLAGFLLAGVIVVIGREIVREALRLSREFPFHVDASIASYAHGYVDASNNLRPGQIVVIGAFLFTFVVYLVMGILRYLRQRAFQSFPSLAYVLLLVTLACWTLTGISFFLDPYRFPVTLLIILYGIGTSLLGRSDHYYRVFHVKSEDPMPSPAQVLQAADSDSVILVAANGGGIQSAAWTAKVLVELDRLWRKAAGEEPQLGDPGLFARSIRAISSVSGGSVGAMFFTAAYEKGGLPENGAVLDKVEEAAKASSLDDIAWGLVYPDLWRTIAPFLPRFEDRGNALEAAFERLVPPTAHPLATWRRSVAEGLRPANLFNGTLTESGGRCLVSTAQFQKPHRACSQFYDHFKDYDLSISTAARLSATFPFVTPAARADVEGKETPEFHVVDGGYYDNYGMATLVEWLQEALTFERTPIRRVLVLQLRGFPPDPEKRPDKSRTWFYQLYAPIATMLHARSCGQLAHNDNEFELLKQVCNARQIDVETAVFQFEKGKEMGDPPLSWHLTNRQKQAIDACWNEVGPKEFAIVREFLRPAPRAQARAG